MEAGDEETNPVSNLAKLPKDPELKQSWEGLKKAGSDLVERVQYEFSPQKQLEDYQRKKAEKERLEKTRHEIAERKYKEEKYKVRELEKEKETNELRAKEAQLNRELHPSFADRATGFLKSVGTATRNAGNAVRKVGEGARGINRTPARHTANKPYQRQEESVARRIMMGDSQTPAMKALTGKKPATPLLGGSGGSQLQRALFGNPARAKPRAMIGEGKSPLYKSLFGNRRSKKIF